MATWLELAGGSYSLDIGKFEVSISPDNLRGGWGVMILGFNHVFHRTNRQTLEQAKQSALTTLIAMLDAWKTQAEAARVALDEATQ